MPSPSSVQSLDRGLRLLEAVSASEDGLSLGEMAGLLGISQPATFNLANTLVQRNYLEKSERPVRYLAGPMIFEIAASRSGRGHAGAKQKAVTELASQFPGSTVMLAERAGDDFTVSLRIIPQFPGVVQRPMSPLPNLYTMATGLCALAHLDAESRHKWQLRYPFTDYGLPYWKTAAGLEAFLKKVSKRGAAMLQDPSRFRVAAPVRDSGDVLVGAVGLSYHDYQPDSPEKVEKAVTAAANSISLKLQN